MMKRLILVITISLTVFYCGQAQGINTNRFFADEQYHLGSNQYISGSLEQALQTVNQGLERVPDHQKLQELKKLLEQEKQEQEQQQQDQQDQQQQNEQNQDQQEQQENQQNEEQQDQQGDQEQKEQEQNEEEQQSEEQDPNEEMKKEMAEKLEEMNMSEEKARMILEAMKNSERQYLQQLRRKATKKNTGKPDW